MRIIISFFLFFILSSSTFFASEKQNVFYISIDGLSRDTLYALIQKNALPNIQEIINRGNYRNMTLDASHITYRSSYSLLFSGKELEQSDGFDYLRPLPFKASVFEQIKQQHEKLYTGVMISSPQAPEEVDSPSLLLKLASPTIDVFKTERYRSAADVAIEVEDILAHFQSHFFVFFNFVDVEYVGRRYREGAERYSAAVRKCDDAIGRIIQSLKDRGLWETTDFFITTNYGYQSKTQNKSKDTWIVSTRKIIKKGVSSDIVPTLYSLYDLKEDKSLYTEEQLLIEK